jgi:hypothetical protein
MPIDHLIPRQDTPIDIRGNPGALGRLVGRHSIFDHQQGPRPQEYIGPAAYAFISFHSQGFSPRLDITA